MVQQPCRIHPTRHVHRISPNVVLWLSGSNHAGNHGANIDANPKSEIVERMHVHLLDLVEKLQCIVCHCGDMLEVDQVTGLFGETGGGHVSGAGALDLFDGSKRI